MEKKNKKKMLWKIFISTLYLSAFTFGGGYVIVTLMKKKFVDDYHWIEENEMLDLVAIAQSSPGAIAVNGAIVVGYKLAGILGTIVAIIGTVIPPFLIISIISFCYNAFRSNYFVSQMLEGMQAGVGAVIASVSYEMGAGIISKKDVVSVLIMIGAFIAACDDMVRACQEHGVIFMAGHVMNFFHGVRHAKKLINDGVIGKVLYCHSARNGWEEQQPTISWKKIREKSGGHLYHHIHELDCVQFLMGGMPEEVTMTGGNVAHQGEAFGDEDDMLFVNMQFSDNRYAVLEWGSAFHWPEHYVLIQGTKGAIKIDMCDCGGTLKIDGKDEHFLVHESQEEDDDRTRIYHSTEMDGAIMYGKPGKKPPMWLHSIMKNEMKYLNGILHGKEVDEEFRPLLTGEAARAAIATADACTRSRFEDRKVKLSEIIG